jgi:hypothetical protein
MVATVTSARLRSLMELVGITQAASITNGRYSYQCKASFIDSIGRLNGRRSLVTMVGITQAASITNGRLQLPMQSFVH